MSASEDPDRGADSADETAAAPPEKLHARSDAFRFKPGTMLAGRYCIVAPLGAGGMGEVYRARDAKLDREVALKVLPTHLSDDSASLARFEREAKAVAALSHPNILAIHDLGTHDGVAYAVMELLDGETLRGKLDAGSLARKQAVDYALEVAGGLAAAHEKGVVHRDLKPENLFVTRDGHVKILDFGLAKRVRPVVAGSEISLATISRHTEPGTVMGTVGYMSPEQARGLPVDHRSDIFSFGAILYELLSGKGAFKRNTAADSISAILSEEPPELAGPGRDLVSLEHVVRHCLEKDRDNRFQSARDIAFALSQASVTAVTSDSRGVGARRASKRNVLVPAIAGVVLLSVAAVPLLRRRPLDPPTPARPSIAVLPFTNLSADKEQEYFSDGLSEELMGLLTKVKELHVAGRTSSFAFKGKTEDLASIAQKLHVATVLEGSVRRSGDRIRVSTQLVNVADGYQIWAETYDRKMTDVFAVQDEIAAAVVAALRVKLLPGERPAVSRHRTSIPEAYNQYLLGQQLVSRGTPESFRRSSEAYQRAIKLDPNYAAAYAGLATAEFWAAESAETTAAVAAARQRAMAAVDHAIALDPELAQGYAIRASLRSNITWDWVGAQADIGRALALDPGSSNIRIRHGYLLSSLGRLPEAIVAARKAIELDPLSPRGGSNLGRFLSATGQFSQAREALTRALEINPEDEWVHFNLGTTALLEGRPEVALAEFQHAGKARSLAGAAMADHDLGRAKDSQEALDELIAKHAHNSAYRIAEVYAWRGERDKAFEWLDRAYSQLDGVLAELKFDPLLSKLRGDARYAAMLKRLNLPVGD
jgi:serine/threonine protein kinase/tetratricopeptide (TPR) repeat protein